MVETDSRSKAIIRNNNEIGQVIQLIVKRDADNYTLFATESGIGLWNNSTNTQVGYLKWQ